MTSLRVALKLSLAELRPGESAAAAPTASKEASSLDKQPQQQPPQQQGPRKRKGSGSFDVKDSTKKKTRKGSEDGSSSLFADRDDSDSVHDKRTEESSLLSRLEEDDSFDKSTRSSTPVEPAPPASGSSSTAVEASESEPAAARTPRTEKVEKGAGEDEPEEPEGKNYAANREESEVADEMEANQHVESKEDSDFMDATANEPALPAAAATIADATDDIEDAPADAVQQQLPSKKELSDMAGEDSRTQSASLEGATASDEIAPEDVEANDDGQRQQKRRKRTPSILKALELHDEAAAAVALAATIQGEEAEGDADRPRYVSSRAAAKAAKTKLSSTGVKSKAPAAPAEEEVSNEAAGVGLPPSASKNRRGSTTGAASRKSAAPIAEAPAIPAPVPLEWVQCDKCNKWRSIASSVDKNSLPDSWFCEMNTWSTVYNSCAAPEEEDTTTTEPAEPLPAVAAAAAEPKSDRKLKAKAPRVQRNVSTDSFLSTPAAGESLGEEEGEARATRTKRQSRQSFGAASPSLTNPNQIANGSNAGTASGGSGAALNWVQCNKCKKWRKVAEHVDIESLPEKWFCSLNTWSMLYARCSTKQEEDDTPNNNGLPGSTSTPMNQSRARRSSGAPSSALPIASTITLDNGVKMQQINWVRCEHKNCKKWRKVPAYIDMSSLPEKWYCEFNTWDPDSASCDIREDSDDEADVGGAAANARNGLIMANSKGASQLSYRRIIFGNDGKIRTCFSDKNKLGFGIYSYMQPNRVMDSEDPREPVRKLTYWWSSAYDDSKALLAASAAANSGRRKQQSSSLSQSGAAGSGQGSSAFSSALGSAAMSSDDLDAPIFMSTTHSLEENTTHYLLDAARKHPFGSSAAPRASGPPSSSSSSTPSLFSSSDPSPEYLRRTGCTLLKQVGKAQRIVEELPLFQRVHLEDMVVRSALLVGDDRYMLLSDLWRHLHEMRFHSPEAEAIRRCMSIDNVKMAVLRLERLDEVDVAYTASGQLVVVQLLPLSTLRSVLASKREKFDRLVNAPIYGAEWHKQGVPLKIRKYYTSKYDFAPAQALEKEKAVPATPVPARAPRGTSSTIKALPRRQLPARGSRTQIAELVGEEEEDVERGTTEDEVHDGSESGRGQSQEITTQEEQDDGVTAEADEDGEPTDEMAAQTEDYTVGEVSRVLRFPTSQASGEYEEGEEGEMEEEGGEGEGDMEMDDTAERGAGDMEEEEDEQYDEATGDNEAYPDMEEGEEVEGEEEENQEMGDEGEEGEDGTMEEAGGEDQDEMEFGQQADDGGEDMEREDSQGGEYDADAQTMEAEAGGEGDGSLEDMEEGEERAEEEYQDMQEETQGEEGGQMEQEVVADRGMEADTRGGEENEGDGMSELLVASIEGEERDVQSMPSQQVSTCDSQADSEEAATRDIHSEAAPVDAAAQ